MLDRRRAALTVFLSVALAVSLFGAAGCVPPDEDGTDGTTAEQPVSGGTLEYFIANPAFIDPIMAVESEGIQVIQAVFDSLVAYDPLTSEVVPAAAESWEPNEDFTEWTFNLRRDATFHDGSDVTAQSFKDSWERIADPANESQVAGHLSSVMGFGEMQAEDEAARADELSGVTVGDDHTLKVELSAPNPDFEFIVGHPGLAPVPEAALGDEEAAADFAMMPVGNGPFEMSEPWAPDEYIKVERFDDYYGDAPYVDAIDFRIFADADTAYQEYKAGNLDMTLVPSGEIEGAIEEYGLSADGYTVSPGKQMLVGPIPVTSFVAFNLDNETLAEPLVRQAISLAMNRVAVADGIYGGTRTPATGIVQPGIPGFQEGAWAYSLYDPEAAADALADAGYPDGEGLPALPLSYHTGAGHERTVQSIQSDLATVGIEVTLDGMESAELQAKVGGGDFVMARMAWGVDYPIQEGMLGQLFHSESPTNFFGYADGDVDDKLAEARTTVDEDDRIDLYREVETMIGEDTPVAPLVFYGQGSVGSDRIRGGVLSPMGLFDFVNVWIAQE